MLSVMTLTCPKIYLYNYIFLRTLTTRSFIKLILTRSNNTLFSCAVSYFTTLYSVDYSNPKLFLFKWTHLRHFKIDLQGNFKNYLTDGFYCTTFIFYIFLLTQLSPRTSDWLVTLLIFSYWWRDVADGDFPDCRFPLHDYRQHLLM